MYKVLERSEVLPGFGIAEQYLKYLLLHPNLYISEVIKFLNESLEKQFKCC